MLSDRLCAQWTSVTRDGKRSAQFEHSLLVTDAGCEVLTRNAGDDQRPWFQRQSPSA